MKISELIINNIRNHSHTELTVNPGLNIIYGLNGTGKTSVLESIAVAAFTKSFLPVPDATVINYEKDFYSVGAKAVSDLGIPYWVKVLYNKGLKKEISSTAGDNLLPKAIIGDMPVVILSPDYKSITFGKPEDRRQFVDRILSQACKLYIDDLIKYRKILKQRNKLLKEAKLSGRYDFTVIQPWTDLLIDKGASVTARRAEFIKEFAPTFRDEYQIVVGGKEIADISYKPDGIRDESLIGNISKDEIVAVFRENYQELKDKEIRRGSTLFGPQKDDYRISLDKGAAKENASQGQHKSLLISIKFAEFKFLKEKRNETPIILLDDVFAELDRERTVKVFELIRNNAAQTFITVTEPEGLKKVLDSTDDYSFFSADAGTITTAEL